MPRCGLAPILLQCERWICRRGWRRRPGRSKTEAELRRAHKHQHTETQCTFMHSSLCTSVHSFPLIHSRRRREKSPKRKRGRERETKGRGERLERTRGYAETLFTYLSASQRCFFKGSHPLGPDVDVFLTGVFQSNSNKVRTQVLTADSTRLLFWQHSNRASGSETIKAPGDRLTSSSRRDHRPEPENQI